MKNRLSHIKTSQALVTAWMSPTKWFNIFHCIFLNSALTLKPRIHKMWATVRRVLHISKVVLIGPGQLEVQRAELIRVFFLSCWVGPRQNTEVVSVKQLSFKWIVGVHHDLLSLKARTETELQLKPCRQKSTTQTEQTVVGIWIVRKRCLHPVKMSQLFVSQQV